jgi:hemoglobin
MNTPPPHIHIVKSRAEVCSEEVRQLVHTFYAAARDAWPRLLCRRGQELGCPPGHPRRFLVSLLRGTMRYHGKPGPARADGKPHALPVPPLADPVLRHDREHGQCRPAREGRHHRLEYCERLWKSFENHAAHMAGEEAKQHDAT